MEAITLQTFFIGLMAVSALGSLVTEAIKKILKEYNKSYRANTLTAVVTTVLSIGIGVGYMLFKDIAFNTQSIIYLVVLVFASWLCSMVGYDKVVQTISQVKDGRKGDGK